jgi:hypothetical protein
MFAQRNDLLFEVTNTTTFPGYGYFLEQVYNCSRILPLQHQPLFTFCSRDSPLGPKIGTQSRKTVTSPRCTAATTELVCGL